MKSLNCMSARGLRADEAGIVRAIASAGVLGVTLVIYPTNGR